MLGAKRHRWLACVIASAGAFGLTTSAWADKIIMKDKRVFEGKILSEADDLVEIDTIVTGIRVTMKLHPKNIREVVKEELPPDFFGKPKDSKPAPGSNPAPGNSTPAAGNASGSGTPAASSTNTSTTPKPADTADKPKKALVVEPPPPAPPVPAMPDPKDVGETPYLEVPLVGTFGVNIVPEGIKESLEFADKQPKIKHIVFVIDSPGGQLPAADEILKLLKKYSTRFEYHIIIKRAISASVFVVFACDTIHMVDGATFGGAVAYRMGTFGHAEVDQKMNSIICATVRAEAEHKKHPADLVDAMMIQAATCAAWKDKEGKAHVATALPKGTPPESIIFKDDEERVLTLTQKQAIEIELAVAHKGGAETLDKSLGLTGWKKFNDHGQWAMETKAAPVKAKEKAAEAYIKRINELGPYIDQNFDEAMRFDPDNHKHDFASYNTGKFTEDSKRKWIQDTDAAMAALGRVRKALDELQDLQDQLIGAGLPRHVSELWMKDTIERCDRDIKRLKMGRTRNGP